MEDLPLTALPSCPDPAVAEQAKLLICSSQLTVTAALSGLAVPRSKTRGGCWWHHEAQDGQDHEQLQAKEGLVPGFALWADEEIGLSAMQSAR